MRGFAEIHADVRRLVHSQMRATVNHRRTLGRESAKAISNPLPASPEPHEPPQGIREPRKHYLVDRGRKRAA